MTAAVTLSHGAESDDLFLFYALDRGLVDTRGLEFRQERHDIETLDRSVGEERFDIVAISSYAYVDAAPRYSLMDVGAAVGDGYGLLVVSRRPLTPQELEEVTVAIPGERSTAALALRLFCPGVRTRALPSHAIAREVAKGNVDAGVLIHEEQLHYHEFGLCRVVDLGEWWRLEFGFPLPLRINAIRRSLDAKVKGICCDVMQETVRYALDHRREALEYVLAQKPDLTPDDADRFLGMYVNSFTADLGERGAQSLALLFRLAHERGIIPRLVTPDLIG